jgi:hypothetical protein
VKGFRIYEQHGLILASGDHPTIDIPLVAGDISQTVTVTAAPPLLGTEDANIGQVVAPQLAEDLPLNGHNPMSYAQYATRVTATTNPVGVRPFDNSTIASSCFCQQGAPLTLGNLLTTGQPINYNARKATEYTGVAGQYGTTYPSFNINAFYNSISST